jgi:hypothetical protein
MFNKAKANNLWLIYGFFNGFDVPLVDPNSSFELSTC